MFDTHESLEKFSEFLDAMPANEEPIYIKHVRDQSTVS